MPGSTVLLIGASMAALLVISLFTFLCSNRRQAHRAPPSLSQRSVVDVELGYGCAAAGIDEAVLAAYTTTVYSLAAARRRGEGQMAAAEAAADGDQPPDDTDTDTHRRARCAWRSTRTATSSAGCPAASTRSTGCASTSGSGGGRAARSAARPRSRPPRKIPEPSSQHPRAAKRWRELAS